MKYEVSIAMCHTEFTIVELEEEDIKDKTEDEIEDFIHWQAMQQIRRECPGYEPETVIEITEIKE